MGSKRLAALIATIIICLAAVIAAFLLFTSAGASFLLDVASSRLLGTGHVKFERLEGSLFHGMVVHNVEAGVSRYFPKGTRVRVQELGARATQLDTRELQLNIINARVISPHAETVVVNGTLRDQVYAVNAYANTLDLAVLAGMLKNFLDLPLRDGDLKDIDLYLSGSMDRPRLKGKLIVEHLPNRGFVLQDAVMTVDLAFMPQDPQRLINGHVTVTSGWLRGPHSVLRFDRSRIAFNGAGDDPQLDIHATSQVGRTHIDITLKGTRQQPRLILASDPPSPQEQLALMLATGKRWDSLSTLATTNKMTPEVTGDFVDYIFFGGSGQKLAGLLGLSQVTYKFDEKSQGVAVQKDLTDRVGVGYGVSVSTTGPETSAKEVTQTVEGEYRVTRGVTVGAQREFKKPAPMDVDAAQRKIPDDRVYLRIRTSF